jgi:tight adherence protein B
MKRIALLLATIVGIGALAAGSAMADSVELSEAQGAKFPSKTFVLTLPERRVLTADGVTLSENGEPVAGLRVVPGDAGGARTFGVVLVIDTSESMQGEPIAAAMEAARQFASHRPTGQRLGVVFFSHDWRLGLPLTTDPAKIAEALASPPPLSKGTRLYDATAAGLRTLNAARVSVGSVVVLSDGADVGSVLRSSAVADAARRTHTRVFSVGLRSRSYNGSTLRELASASGGRYAEASPAQLGTLFASLGRRFGREYLVTYRSTAPLGSTVKVAAAVAGAAGVARTTYSTPPDAAEVQFAPAHKSGFWSSTRALALAALLAALLFGVGVWLLLKPATRSVQTRIASFVTDDFGLLAHSPEEVELLSALTTGRRSDRLNESRAWKNFARDVDVARLDIEPRRLALFAIVGTVLAVVLADAAVSNGFLGVLALGIPVLVVMFVRAAAERERRKFEMQLPDNLQVVASAMRAGQSFTGALSVAVEDAAEPARRELNRTVTDERLGMPVDEALARAAERMRSEELEYVGLVARLQRDSGGNTAEVIDRVTETIRERAELKREVRTLTAQGRLSGSIVSALPLLLVAVLGATSPGYFDPLIHEPAGRVLIVIGCLLLGVGWLAIRRVVAIKI